MYQISLKTKKLFVDGHLRPTLLGRLGEVDLIYTNFSLSSDVLIRKVTMKRSVINKCIGHSFDTQVRQHNSPVVYPGIGRHSTTKHVHIANCKFCQLWWAQQGLFQVLWGTYIAYATTGIYCLIRSSVALTGCQHQSCDRRTDKQADRTLPWWRVINTWNSVHVAPNTTSLYHLTSLWEH